MSKKAKDKKNQAARPEKPNLLFITVDQMRFPDFSDGDTGMIKDLKEIFSFGEVSENNPYIKYFPGFMRLRQHAVSLQNHHIGTSACVPSRTLIYTGQYGTRTHVTETDSLFKFGSDPNFPWLDPRGIPTTGDWFRAAGYDTHYFGKWDMSYVDIKGPLKGDINDWGFSDWKLSSPDAQGGQLNQLGVYRDEGYADLANSFLRRKAMNYESTPDAPNPWFATVSIVNPHDIASAYPISWWMPENLKHTDYAPVGVQTIESGSKYDDPDMPKPVPAKGARSNVLPGGTATVDLNPHGFATKKQVFTNPSSINDDLSTKPDCQFDYSYKMGLALKSRRPKPIQKWQTLPFQTYKDQGNPELFEDWFQSYGQMYAYMHTLADAQIDSVLKTLDESGLSDNTIVVFLSDHGEYGGVQGGMIEKWHTAYDQILRVPVVFSSPKLNDSKDKIKTVDQLTSHIDILPTLLSFAGYKTYKKQHKLGRKINKYYDQTYFPLPGSNLYRTLKNPKKLVKFPNKDIKGRRKEILFTTDDTITNHLKGEAPTRAYNQFLEIVEEQMKLQPRLKPGPVVQPNHIRCIKWVIGVEEQSVKLKDSCWKLSRYWDPEGNEDDQWEFYNLDADPAERNNLVTWRNSNPIVEPKRIDTACGLNVKDVQQALELSQQRLVYLEKLYLEPVSPFEEAYVMGAERRIR